MGERAKILYGKTEGDEFFVEKFPMEELRESHEAGSVVTAPRVRSA
jgi:hypothetical protein